MWCLVALSIALMVCDHRYHRLDQAKQLLSLLIYPMQWAVDAPIRSFFSIQSYCASHHQLVRENVQLKETQLLQSGQLQQLQALEAENARLRVFLQSSHEKRDELSVAEIIQVDSDPFNHRILLNKGSRQDVYVGQPIIDAEGVMGNIIEVNEWTSAAILVTDASHAIPVENVRNGVRGIVVGTGSFDSLALQYVSTTADIQAGDTLVTSGLGGRYPHGYPVGKVTHIRFEPGHSFAVVQVKPSAYLERGRQILLVKGHPAIHDSETKSASETPEGESQADIEKQVKITEESPIKDG